MMAIEEFSREEEGVHLNIDLRDWIPARLLEMFVATFAICWNEDHTFFLARPALWAQDDAPGRVEEFLIPIDAELEFD